MYLIDLKRENYISILFNEKKSRSPFFHILSNEIYFAFFF